MNAAMMHGALYQGLALVAVIGLVFALGWLARRLQRRLPGGRMPLKIVGGTAVGARERVVVLELGSTWLVVGVAPGRVNALHTMQKLDGDIVPTAAPAADNVFSSWLSRTMDRRSRNDRS